MKVAIDFEEEELGPLVQRHLESGVSVASEVRRAVRLYLHLLVKEKEGNSVGYGDKSRFASYNKVVKVEGFEG